MHRRNDHFGHYQYGVKFQACNELIESRKAELRIFKSLLEIVSDLLTPQRVQISLDLF